MKYLVALFLVSLALQPMDLQACAMGADQETGHHATVHEGGDSDCCNPADSQTGVDCEQAGHCAFLSHAFLVIPPDAAPLQQGADHGYRLIAGDHYSGPPPRPLFRPPIA